MTRLFFLLGLWLANSLFAAEFEPNSIFGVCQKTVSSDTLRPCGVKWIRRDLDYSPKERFEENIKGFEAVAASARKNGIMVLGILHPRDFIKSYHPGEKAGEGVMTRPTLMEWGNWVYRAVLHFKTQVGYWEIANEPDQATTAEQYTAINNMAYLAAKNADPKCFVGSFSTAGVNLPFIERCLESGIGDYFDFVSVHPYQWSHSFNPSLLAGQMKGLEKLLEKYHCRRPIWITEFGWPSHAQGGVSWERQGDLLAQLYLTCAGLERYKTFWYCYGDWWALPTDQEGNFGLFDGPGKPKPAARSYRTVARILAGARSLGWADLPPGLCGWRYRLLDGKTAMSVWGNSDRILKTPIKLPGVSGKTVEMIRIDGSRTSLDINNGIVEAEVSQRPVILIYPGKSQNVLKPFPAIATRPGETRKVFISCGILKPFSPGQRVTIPYSIINLSEKDISNAFRVRWPEGWKMEALSAKIPVKSKEEKVNSVDITIPAGIRKGKYKLVFRYEGARDIPIEIEVSHAVSVDIRPLNRPLSGKNLPIHLVFSNQSNRRLKGHLSAFISNCVFIPDNDLWVSLEPFQTTEVTRSVDVQGKTDGILTLKGKIAGEEINFSRPLDFTIISRLTQAPKLDGDLDEWKDRPGFSINRIEQVRAMKNWWLGPDFLSAKVWTGWDAANFYFAADVKDEVHFQPSVDGSTWLGDGFQLAFGVNGTYGYEFTLAKTSAGPQIYCLQSPNGFTGFPKGATLAVRVLGKSCLYEAAIPWTALKPLRPEAGKTIPFNFILNNNNGAGRLGWMENRPGIGSGKSTSGWYQWQWGE